MQVNFRDKIPTVRLQVRREGSRRSWPALVDYRRPRILKEKSPSASSLKSSSVGFGSQFTKFGNVNQKSLTYETRNRRDNVVSFSGHNECDNDLLDYLISPCYSPLHAESADMSYVVLRTFAL